MARRIRLVGASLMTALLCLFVIGVASISAQEATPATGGGGQASDVPHPAHIHEGTCANLNPNPKYPLANVEFPSAAGMASPAAASPVASPGAMVGTAGAVPAELSVTKVDVSLNDLLSGQYAINVHESMENISHYIACGDIGGMVSDGNLIFGLQQQNDSGYAGTAWLKDNGDGTTTVTVFLVKGLAGGAAPVGTPAATPAA